MNKSILVQTFLTLNTDIAEQRTLFLGVLNGMNGMSESALYYWKDRRQMI